MQPMFKKIIHARPVSDQRDSSKADKKRNQSGHYNADA